MCIYMKNLPLSIAFPRAQKHSCMARLCDTPQTSKHLILRLILRALGQATAAEQRLLWMGPGVARVGIFDHPIITDLAAATNIQRAQVCGLLGDRPKEWTTINVRPAELHTVNSHGGRDVTEIAINRAREGVWTELCLGILGPQRIFETITINDRADRELALGWHKHKGPWTHGFIGEDEAEIMLRWRSAESTTPAIAPAPARTSIFAGVETAVVPRTQISEDDVVIPDA